MPPLILITNDDGYDAPGIRALEQVAQKFGTVVKIAPDKPQSGMGHAITINYPLRIIKCEERDNFVGYQCSGTPVDCIKLGIDQILGQKPDLVLSGINHGSNASINLIYSGTMGAALEGKIEKVPSIGFSLLNHSHDANFDGSMIFAEKIIAKALQKLDECFCLNVNIPNIDANLIKGIKFSKQSNTSWVEEFDKRQDPSGKDYYWLSGNFDPTQEQNEDTDLWALENGYVSVVPVIYDMTDYQFLSKSGSWRV